MKPLIRPCAMAALALATFAGSAQAAWYEDVKFKGDLRYRFESIEGEDTAAGTATEYTRTRQRIRFRYGAYGKVNETTTFGFRLATGGGYATGGGPTSTNETFSNNFSNLEVALDLAYVDVSLNDHASVTVGKMKNPYWRPQKSQRVWDGDVTPEGLALSYKNGSFFGNLGYVLPDSDTNGGKVEILGSQLGMSFGGFKGALSYYKTSSDTPAALASTLRGTADFLSLGLEYNFNLGEVKSAVYVEYVDNQDGSGAANMEESTYEVGFNFKNGKWKAGLAYMDAGGEGTTGFNDNDFLDSGDGGVNGAEGIRLSGGYNFAKNSDLGFYFFTGDQNVDVAAPATENDYTGYQIDLKFKF